MLILFIIYMPKGILGAILGSVKPGTRVATTASSSTTTTKLENH
jgi:hypothetical protein